MFGEFFSGLLTVDLNGPVDCDRLRIAQLLSNLIANALTHGSANHPVRVCAATRDDQFELSVSNAGEPILPELIGRLFLPFVRASASPHQHGLGLGLYIASEIAKAHGGTLVPESTVEETRFAFLAPATRRLAGWVPLPEIADAVADAEMVLAERGASAAVAADRSSPSSPTPTRSIRLMATLTRSVYVVSGTGRTRERC